MTERITSNIGPPCAEKAGADFRLSVAGLSVRVSGLPASVVPTLESLLSAMSDRGTDRLPDLSVSWDGLTVVAQPGHRRVRAGSQDHIPSLTLILLLERLCVARPGLQIVHGNGVAVSSSQRGLLIVGDSGAGKTTLTREILASSDDRLLAEDTLLLDLEQMVLHPFPRAASLRMEPEAKDGPSADHRWSGLGVRRVEKALVPPQRIHSAPFPLARTDIVILESPQCDIQPCTTADEVCGEIYWLSHVEPSLLPLICDQVSSEATIGESKGASVCPSIAFARPLDPRQRSLLISLLAQHGIMILASQVAGQAPPGKRVMRPSSPLLQHVSSFDGLRRLLDFSVAFGAPDLPTADRSRLLMRLAHVFNGTRFLCLTPGGTPADTIACLRAVLDAKPR